MPQSPAPNGAGLALAKQHQIRYTIPDRKKEEFPMILIGTKCQLEQTVTEDLTAV